MKIERLKCYRTLCQNSPTQIISIHLCDWVKPVRVHVCDKCAEELKSTEETWKWLHDIRQGMNQMIGVAPDRDERYNKQRKGAYLVEYLTHY